MTLNQRFLFAFGLVFALMAMTSLYVIGSFLALAERGREVKRIATALAAASRADTETLQASLLLEQIVVSRDLGKVQSLHAHRKNAAEARQVLRQLSRLPDILQRLDSYERLLPARTAVADKIVDSVSAGASLAQILEIKKARDRLDSEALIYPREIKELEFRAIGESLAAMSSHQSRTIRGVVVMAAVTLVATLVISLWTSRNLAHRLAPLTKVAISVTHGNFTARSPVGGSDEISVLAKALNRMAGELQQLDKAKDEFVALASHQLRTPASAVRGNISMLLDGYFGPVPPEQQSILEDAYASNERQLEIVTDMLTVARAELGRLRVSKATTDLVQLLDAAVAEHRFAIQSREQVIDVAAPAALECRVDAPKMKIVLDNLISNACKYTPRNGSIRVRLSARDGGVVLEVEDNGVGIPEESRDRLFKKFSRIENPLSAESGGTGLGLYLANEIVKLHGGEIHLISSESMGSTFSVRLPAG